MGSRILLVENHPDTRLDLTIQLRDFGYEIIEARDYQDILEKALEGKPDIIITDLGGPGIDGVKNTAHIRQNSETANIPVIAYTGWVSQEYKENALKAGVTAYLVKPVSPKLLRNVIEALC